MFFLQINVTRVYVLKVVLLMLNTVYGKWVKMLLQSAELSPVHQPALVSVLLFRAI